MLTIIIAWRNILRHKGKSMVIGIILFLGAFIMTIGLSIAKGSEKGFEDNFVSRFTGQIILVSKEEKKTNVLFTYMGKSLKVIKDYQSLENVLSEQDYIEDFIPMTRGYASVLGLEQEMWGILAMGTKFEDYQQTFNNNIYAIEGQLLKNGERGILISERIRNELYRMMDIWIVPQGYELVEENLSEEALENKDSLDIRHELIFIGWAEDTMNTDIRLPIKGIIRYEKLNAALYEISFMDIESYRECFGYFSAADKAVAIDQEDKLALSFESDEDVFLEEDFLFDVKLAESEAEDISYDIESLKVETNRENVHFDLDSGAYNYVSVILKPGINTKEAMDKLNRVIEETGVDTRIIHWKDASGQVSQLALFLQGAVSIFVGLLFFVAIIIIMNTLSMSAIERTEEIGMMRAIGAFKGFIAKMFMAETSLLSFIFGGLGIISGALISIILGFCNIEAGNNEMIFLFFGGDALKPIVDIELIINGIIQLAFITIIAMIYPLMVARKITPLDAVTRD